MIMKKNILHLAVSILVVVFIPSYIYYIAFKSHSILITCLCLFCFCPIWSKQFMIGNKITLDYENLIPFSCSIKKKYHILLKHAITHNLLYFYLPSFLLFTLFFFLITVFDYFFLICIPFIFLIYSFFHVYITVLIQRKKVGMLVTDILMIIPFLFFILTSLHFGIGIKIPFVFAFDISSIQMLFFLILLLPFAYFSSLYGFIYLVKKEPFAKEELKDRLIPQIYKYV